MWDGGYARSFDAKLLGRKTDIRRPAVTRRASKAPPRPRARRRIGYARGGDCVPSCASPNRSTAGVAADPGRSCCDAALGESSKNAVSKQSGGASEESVTRKRFGRRPQSCGRSNASRGNKIKCRTGARTGDGSVEATGPDGGTAGASCSARALVTGVGRCRVTVAPGYAGTFAERRRVGGVGTIITGPQAEPARGIAGADCETIAVKAGGPAS